MNDFDIGQDTEREPVGMKVVGIGVIVSCLVLSSLFAWGIYLDLAAKDCSCPVHSATLRRG